MYNVVWENGRVALSIDLIFGLVVMSEQGWYPVAQLDMEDRLLVQRLVDCTPGCPFQEKLDKLCTAD